jgi:hypothetical protein
MIDSIFKQQCLLASPRKQGELKLTPTPTPSLRAKRSNPGATSEELDCFVASLLAMTLVAMLHPPPSYPAWAGIQYAASFRFHR